jgi:predicted ester cyclase
LDYSISLKVTDLSIVYRGYIACLNEKDWPRLGDFVHDQVIYNGLKIGLSGYRKLLQKDFDEIPDLWFEIGLLVSDSAYVASRLQFNCTPKKTFPCLQVSGKKNLIHRKRVLRV